MNQTKEQIKATAQAMLKDNESLPAILFHAASEPRWRPILAMVLRDARQVYRHLDAILDEAALRAAEEQIQVEALADREEARLSHDPFASSEWSNAKEAA